LDIVAHTDFEGAASKMGEKNERASSAAGDHDMVPCDGWRTTSNAAGLAEQVGQEGQLRPSGLMVGFVVVSDDHPTRARGEDGGTEADEVLGRLGCNGSSPTPRG